MKGLTERERLLLQEFAEAGDTCCCDESGPGPFIEGDEAELIECLARRGLVAAHVPCAVDGFRASKALMDDA